MAKLVVAVSGGVDSMVLLHKLVARGAHQLIVAHFDHGIRDDSHHDEVFVRSLAELWGCQYRTQRVELGREASEAVAREHRYKFLRQVCDKTGAEAIVTAHHADDVLETIAFNCSRSDSWRGLCSLRPRTDRLYRPLLEHTKAELIDYALEHRLEWREDSTNTSDRYTRNRLRRRLAHLPSAHKKALHDKWRIQCQLRRQIEAELQRLTEAEHEMQFSRYWLTMIDNATAHEYVRWIVFQATGISLQRHQQQAVVYFAKSAAPDKQLQLGSSLRCRAGRRDIIVEPVEK